MNTTNPTPDVLALTDQLENARTDLAILKATLALLTETTHGNHDLEWALTGLLDWAYNRVAAIDAFLAVPEPRPVEVAA